MKYLPFVSIGFELIGLILVGIYAGAYLDEKWAGGGLYQSLLIVLALVGWLIRLIFNLKKLNQPK